MKKDEFGRHDCTRCIFFASHGSRRGGVDVDRAGKTWHGKTFIASLFGPFPVESRPRGRKQNTHRFTLAPCGRVTTATGPL
jgi:hypothetical protein